ncbi:hypothetical protein FJ251_02710 [bacterium]|nr:hypothetical protein [bacterium]
MATMIGQRRILATLLAIGVLAIAGCVYWRLFQFKQQLGDFSANFSVESGSSYTLVSLHPLLSDEDVDGLMEVEPSRREQTAGVEWWVYAFHKEPPDGSAPLVYRLGFAEDRLARVEFPAQFTQLYPEDGLSALLSALGGAELDRRERRARARLAREQLAAGLPDRAGVDSILGAPTERVQDADSETWTYRYRLETVTTGEAERKRRAFGQFRFDPAGRLQQLATGIGRHDLTFDVEAARTERTDGADRRKMSP